MKKVSKGLKTIVILFGSAEKELSCLVAVVLELRMEAGIVLTVKECTGFISE